MYRLGWGGPGPYVSENCCYRNVDILGFFLPVLVRFQTDSTAPLPPVPGAFWGGGVEVPPPPFLGAGKFKKSCFGEGWDSGSAVRGKNYEKMGSDVTSDRIRPSVVKKKATLPLKISPSLPFGPPNTMEFGNIPLPFAHLYHTQSLLGLKHSSRPNVVPKLPIFSNLR